MPPRSLSIAFLVLLVACAKTEDPTDETSSSGSSSSTTEPEPTTGAASSTGSTGTTGAESSSSTGEPVDVDALCAVFSAHFVECFPGPDEGEIDVQCHTDIADAQKNGDACFAAMAAYFGCQSTTPCEGYEDACLDEANARINACGG